MNIISLQHKTHEIHRTDGKQLENHCSLIVLALGKATAFGGEELALTVVMWSGVWALALVETCVFFGGWSRVVVWCGEL